MAYEVSNQEESLRKGPWLEVEDETLVTAVALLGERRWDALAKESGLRRSGKCCRLRWLNYLRPNLKHGEITEQDPSVQLYGGFMQISNGNGDCTYVKSCISSTSDNSLSGAVNELSNLSFGRSPYEGRVSEWASSCWLYDQSQRKDENLDNYSSSSTFSYPSWSFEEESDSSIWDCSTSFWS